ncbi:MAG: glycosyltransferase family 4 protein [Chlorobia bacterium]|nr:glycosyltransferase family 4 protein [Fimbriimonadaceae bacterium]
MVSKKERALAMRILLCSHFFFPSIGGIETLSMSLAEQFTSAGHEVVVLTRSSSEKEDHYPFKVVRQPSWLETWRYVRWATVVFHNNICASMAWPLVLLARPWVIAHHTWIARPDGSIGVKERIKRRLVRHAKQIADSKALANDLGGKAVVIGGCYDAQLFRVLPDAARDADLIFVGRLVSDKGADLLIEVLGMLNQTGKNLSLTIVGDGNELANLMKQASKLGLSGQVSFKGTLLGEDLVREINRHKIMVVPSRWNEPFGIVALLGAACGCVVVGSTGGGLIDAIGPCGLTFPNGDVKELSVAIDKLASSHQERQRLLAFASGHLSNFTVESVAARYLDVLSEASR